MKKIAIVTGASRGIGRATAIRIAKEFTGVVLVGRAAEALSEVAKAVAEAGAQSFVIATDLRSAEASDYIVEQTLAKFGQINALINIAGDVPQVDLFQMTDAQWSDSFLLKFNSARRLTLAAWDALKESKGSIVFTSGSTAHTPKAAYAAIATVNAAIVALAKAFADRGAQDGVQVNSVLPGPVMTERRKNILTQWASAKSISAQDAQQHFLNMADIQRFGEPEEVAELMAFLISPGAQLMTGSAIRFDGGEIKSL